MFTDYTNVKEVAIYTRQSVKKLTGESLRDQKEACLKDVERWFGNPVIKYFEDDGISGNSIDARPGFSGIITGIKLGEIKCIVVNTIDRLVRNVGDASEFLEICIKNRVDIICTKESVDISSTDGQTLFLMYAIFARNTRERIRRNIIEHNYSQSERGRKLGGIARLGFNNKKIHEYSGDKLQERQVLEKNDVEMEKVLLVFETYYKIRSLSATSKYLKSIGIKGKQDGKMTTTLVRSILTDVAYVKSSKEVHKYLEENYSLSVNGEANGNGYLSYGKDRTKSSNQYDCQRLVIAVSNHDGVIDSDFWLEIQKIINENSSKKIQNITRESTTKSKKSLFSSIVYCALCGNKMRIKYGHLDKKTNERTGYYNCATRCDDGVQACNCQGVKLNELEFLTIKTLDKININMLHEKILSESVNVKKEDSIGLKGQIEILQTEKRKAESRIRKYNKRIADNVIPVITDGLMLEIEQLLASIYEYKEGIKMLQKKIKEEEKRDVYNLINNIQNFSDVINLISDIDTKRAVINTVFEKITWNSNDNTGLVKYKTTTKS